MLEEWRRAAAELGLRIEAPFVVQLRTGRLEARLLLRHFGARNGMLIVTDFSVIEPFADEVVAVGYGYSTLSEPRSADGYDKETFVEMLWDWGWFGPDDERPAWYIEADDNPGNENP